MHTHTHIFTHKRKFINLKSKESDANRNHEIKST